jgi:hypothetical protein
LKSLDLPIQNSTVDYVGSSQYIGRILDNGFLDMPKKIRERSIDNKTARAKLAPSEKPYWRSVDIGLHLGYRKGLHGGRWVLRRYLGGQTYATESIGTADDNQDADNVSILTFFQAQAKARELAKGYREAPAGAAKLTVRDAIESYLGSSRGRDQHIRLSKHVLTDEIANQLVASLTESALSNWRNRLPEKLSAATRKRITTDFRAALNVFAKLNRKDLPDDLSIIIKHGLASEEKAETGARKAQVLTDADLRRLIEAAWEVDSLGAWEGDLVRVIIVLAATGARFSQVIRMTVGDVQESRLMIPTSAKGRGSKSVARYAVPIGPDVVDALIY